MKEERGLKIERLGGEQSQAQTDTLMDQSKPKQLTSQSLAAKMQKGTLLSPYVKWKKKVQEKDTKMNGKSKINAHRPIAMG